jgi:hypothetical protein
MFDDDDAPCLQCGNILEFDPDEVVIRRGRALRIEVGCLACGARHRLLPDWNLYGIVAPGRTMTVAAPVRCDQRGARRRFS